MSLWQRLAFAWAIITGTAHHYIASLNTRLQIAKEEYMALLDDINALVADYEAKLAAADPAPLQAQIADLQAQVADLQGQIDAADAVVVAKSAELNPPAA